jgi:CelD/BcsL family acetyltransferase involved in cellulose biosynthesis
VTVALRKAPEFRAAATRPVETAVLPLEALERLAPGWDGLVDAAAYPNPFYSRAVIAAHAAHGVGEAPRFCVATRGSDLLALLPVVDRRIGGWWSAAVGWTTPFTTNGTPLIDATALDAGADALLDALCRESRLVMLPLVSLDHPVAGALRRALEVRGWPWHELGSFERPILQRREDANAAEQASGGRRKSLRRRRGKLAERGQLTTSSAVEGTALAEAVEAFLALERAGWKGSRGTALASRPATMGLARQLFQSAGGPVDARADMISLDGRPIAVSLALLCRGTAHLLKTAFDESLRAYAPGIVLEAEIVRACHEECFADRLDSASLPGSVFDDLYPDRERIGDLLFATTRNVSAAELQRVAAAERLRRSAVSRLKRLYSRLSGRR